ncbi:MAG: FAD-binding protein [Proteobacteria bacterium]|nr:FAD-binding protein [Pseudomonadota bacterium]
MASLQSISSWDRQYDLVIAGFGLAAMCAAIEAHDLDPRLSILILEKADEATSGGNSRVAGQSLLISKNAEVLAEYQRKMSVANPIPEDLLVPWSEAMAALEPWIQERAAQAGAEFIHGTGFSERDAVLEFPEFGAREAVHCTATILPIPSGVYLAFRENVRQRPRIEIAYETPLRDLVQDPDTLEVFGVIAEHGGQRVAIRANKGVVMAVGGYEASPDMQRNYYGLSDVAPLGSPHNTGDGIRILQKAGADLWHMRNQGQSGGIWPGYRPDGWVNGFLRNFFWQSFSWIEVDANSERFYNETAELQLTHYKEKKHGRWVDTPHYRAAPVHMIFDATTCQYNKLVVEMMSWNPVVGGYRWSDDNTAEVEKGWIQKADSIEELAEKIGREPAKLRATVERYNAACRDRRDADFQRNPDTLYPIADGPFYAMRIDPVIVCTGGGARRNIRSEVLDHAGKPIPRLYEAGELGSMFSDLYQNGSYLTEAMISGRAAGREIAALSAWQDRP